MFIGVRGKLGPGGVEESTEEGVLKLRGGYHKDGCQRQRTNDFYVSGL